LSRDFPYVFFDCSEIIEWLGAPHAPTADQFVDLVRDVGVDRVMMGSDYPWYEPAHTVALIDQLAFSDGEKAAILGGTAARFLGI
jgi:predicted TIM-barrel fold metal-dependent hydrolase